MRVFCPQLVERAKGASLVRVIWRAARGDIYIRYDTMNSQRVAGVGCSKVSRRNVQETPHKKRTWLKRASGVRPRLAAARCRSQNT
jgi:hypothetical protein